MPILDANILIRFVLGEKVPALLAARTATINFLASAPCATYGLRKSP